MILVQLELKYCAYYWMCIRKESTRYLSVRMWPPMLRTGVVG